MKVGGVREHFCDNIFEDPSKTVLQCIKGEGGSNSLKWLAVINVDFSFKNKEFL